MGIFKLSDSVIDPIRHTYGYDNAKKIVDPYYDNVSLLLPLDKNNWIIDRSPRPKTVTINNYVMCCDSFAAFNGTTTYLSTNNHDDFKFGTGDFTLECWIYLPFYKGVNWANDGCIWGPAYSYNNGGVIYYFDNASGTMGTWDSINGYGPYTKVELLQWVHIVWERKNGYLYGFINGIKGNNYLFNVDHNSTEGFRIGGYQVNNNSRYIAGFLKDFRITKGVARYQRNFTPPGPMINTIP